MRADWARPFWSVVGLLIAYYAFPVNWADSMVDVALSLALTIGGLGLLGAMMIIDLDHLRRGAPGRSARVLSMMLVLMVISFSMAFYLLDLIRTDEISGLRTRTDALYFTLSTMATVGYGDVHAEGQVARALVCALIAFNVVVIASLVRAHTSRRPPPT